MTPIDRLGSVLLHFLWQGVAIGGLYAVLRSAARRATPNARYLLACATLAAMIAAPALTWTELAPAPVPMTPSNAARWAAAASYSPTAPIRFVASTPAPTNYLPWVVSAWLAGAAALSLRLLGGWIIALRLRSRAVRPATAEWQRGLDRLRTCIRVSRPVRLLVSSAAEVPTVVGWLRPLVLVPAGMLAGLPPAQIEALLLHELAHIRRHGYLINLLQSIAETLLFYHPAVWWISAHIRAEREHACDDLAVAATGDVLTYTRALAGMEAARQPRFAVAANGGSLAARVSRLLGRPRSAPRPAPAAILAILALAAAVYAQSAVPNFEVASVKPSAETRFMAVRALPGGRLTATAPLKLIIQNAYSIQDFQIVGGPSWIGSDRFDIDAKAEGNPSRARLLEMLQPLLADRFHLQVHRETRDMPAFILTVAKGGSKLIAPKDGSCTPLDPSAGPPQPGKPFPCGHLGVLGMSSGVRIQGGRIDLPELVRILSMIMGRPVLDRTGLTGTYDINVEFFPDSLAAGLNHTVKDGAPASPQPAAGAPDNGPPSIVTAIQEQLGLKLESAKGPVEVLVIDHVERPTAN